MYFDDFVYVTPFTVYSGGYYKLYFQIKEYVLFDINNVLCRPPREHKVNLP